MNPEQRMEARRRAYGLLSRIYYAGVSPSFQPALQQVPVLAEALLHVYGPTCDADTAAADHQTVFGFNVHPYASVYLNADGRLGGRATEAVLGAYLETGFTPKQTGERADSMGYELDFLDFLMEPENHTSAARRGRAQERQRHFIDTHLLVWLPTFVQAVRRLQHPFYTQVADLTLDLVIDHRTALDPTPAGSLQAPPPPVILNDDRAGLKQIAAYLTRPTWSGLYLSRHDIIHLSRAAQLPRGFGDRGLMLTNLFRAAAEYDHMTTVLSHLDVLIEAECAVYTALGGLGLPAMQRVCNVWLARLQQTSSMLAEMLANINKGEPLPDAHPTVRASSTSG